jgi:hypothetical protein
MLCSLVGRYQHYKGSGASVFSAEGLVPIFWKNLLSPFYLEDGSSRSPRSLRGGRGVGIKANRNCDCKSKKWAFISTPIFTLQEALFVIPVGLIGLTVQFPSYDVTVWDPNMDHVISLLSLGL